ncbi:MAG: hypothetical protein AB7O97_20305 [Planctomycetota bacterium]
MNPPAPSRGPSRDDDALLHCNLERTVLRRGDPRSGTAEVHKLLLRGSELDAQREFDIGARLADLDVVEHLGAGLHQATGHPFVRTRFHDGQDLGALVARGGALAAAEACRLLLPAARTLAAMHAMRTVDFPQGVCHGDVKPANLLATATTTLLLDFEHAGPVLHDECRGTPGFAGPEAAVGAPLTPAFDVYGLGATLHWLLTGRAPRKNLLAAQAAEVRLLIDGCLMPAPTMRPSASIVAEALAELAQRLCDDPLEPARAALLAGELDACRALLAATSAPDKAALAALLARRERLLRRRPDLLAAVAAAAPAVGDPLPEPGPLADRLRLLAAFTRRFPRHPAAIAATKAAKDRAGALLAAALPTLFELVRAEEFQRAQDRLRDLRRLCRIAQALPGVLAVPGDGAAHMPSLLQRSPASCLQQEEQRLATVQQEHEQLLATLRAAEADLALEDAAAVVDRIGDRFGGTSEAVARHRDRLHRLGFYLERIARARANIDRLHELVPDEDPTDLLRFVEECAAAVAAPGPGDADDAAGAGGGAMGLRSLHLALGNLHEEFPALRERSAPGRDSLERMLCEVTDEAWQLLATAEEKLGVEPVPVRPLHVLLGRIDTFRALEAFVDRPQRTRSSLMDRIEWLRLRLEQAQATRDRLARGAEQALAKGHWTTGLFDMERAVTHLESEDDGDRQAERLRKRLAEARQRKEEIEAALRRNHALRARYVALQDQPDSTTADRLQVLREQRDCLQFLAMHAPRERRNLYNKDLRDVELRVAQEQSQQAEAEMDLCESPEERLRIAADATGELEAFATTWEPGAELPGRLSRLLDHWRRRQASLQKEHVARERHARQRRRRRWLAGAAGGALVLLLGWALNTWSGPARAGAHPLAAAARALPTGARAGAERLLQRAVTAESRPGGDALVLLVEVERAVQEFLGDAAGARDPGATSFAASVWAQTVVMARARADAQHEGARAEFERAAVAATDRLRDLGLPE